MQDILSTSKLPEKRNKTVVQRRFGGIALYAYDEEKLEKQIKTIRTAILKVIEKNGPLVPSLARHLAGKSIDKDISQRIFSALLGAELRAGQLDCISCLSDTGTLFRIVIAESGKSKFVRLLGSCLDLVPISGTVNISAIRDKLYPDGDKGNWTRAYYLVARLSYLGVVTFADRFSVERAKDTYDAISSIDDAIHTFDLGRLD